MFERVYILHINIEISGYVSARAELASLTPNRIEYVASLTSNRIEYVIGRM